MLPRYFSGSYADAASPSCLGVRETLKIKSRPSNHEATTAAMRPKTQPLVVQGRNRRNQDLFLVATPMREGCIVALKHTTANYKRVRTCALQANFHRAPSMHSHEPAVPYPARACASHTELKNGWLSENPACDRSYSRLFSLCTVDGFGGDEGMVFGLLSIKSPSSRTRWAQSSPRVYRL